MFVSRHLKTVLPAVTVAMVSLVAYFEARGVNQLVAAEVMADAVVAPHLQALELLQPTAQSGDDVLARNPFDSQTGSLLHGSEPVEPVAGADEADAPPTGQPSVDDPACDSGRVLLISAAETSADSFATIEKAPKDASLYRAGDEIDGGRTLAAIAWDRVWLEDSGAHCQLKLGAPLQASSSKAKRAPRKSKERRARRRSSRTLAPKLAAKIERVSDTEIRVERSLVDELMANPSSLSSLARAVPPRKGETGVKLLGVRADSLLGHLGLKNGDRVATINGFDVSNPQALLGAYGMLQRADALQVQLQRGGKPMTIDVRIH